MSPDYLAAFGGVCGGDIFAIVKLIRVVSWAVTDDGARINNWVSIKPQSHFWGGDENTIRLFF